MQDAGRPGVSHDVLLRVSQAILVQRSVPALLAALVDALAPVAPLDRVGVVLCDPRTNEVSLFCWPQTLPQNAFPGGALLAAGPLSRLENGGWTCEGDEFRQTFPALAHCEPYCGLGSYCVRPLATGGHRLGGVEFIRIVRDGFRDVEQELLSQVANLVALAIENLMDVDLLLASDDKLRYERDYYRVLVDVTNAVIARRELTELLDDVSAPIHRFLGVGYVGLDLHDPATHLLRSHALHFPPGGAPVHLSTELPLEASLAARVFQSRSLLLSNGKEMAALARQSDQVSWLIARGFQASCSLPLIAGGRVLGALHLADSRPDVFSPAHLNLLKEISARIAIALDNALAYEEISRLKDRLASENLYLTEEIRAFGRFGEIIGESAAMTAVLEQVEMVATSDCTVLVLGETGTGKELVARAIHALSDRRAQTMVKMNCAAIPAGLLESDLFGHDKGAFTGAVAQRIGRFELADKGTLFLDEVGDIPLELQPKLLRALQEREIERLGGRRVIPVDVRVIAATNRDLTEMVAHREFRSDLYYRLNVFPIVIPPLRERREDIPLLVRYFTNKIACRMNRHIESIPNETLQRLTQLPWMGNVRELENVIERAVILTRGPVLNLPVSELQYHLSPVSWKSPPPPAPVKAPEPPAIDSPEAERQKIIRILRETNGIVAGPKGAAMRLGLKRTTLLSRMQRLGISVKGLEDDTYTAPDLDSV